MKILLFGAGGQVGTALRPLLAELGETIALERGGSRGLCGDLRCLDELPKTMAAVGPDVIVNAAAFTNVDRAEAELEAALRINAEAPAAMARWAARSGAWLVHFSSDYVFDGSGSAAWTETSPTSPCNAYGRSKLAGDLEVAKSGCRQLVFRTSWVYGDGEGNFAATILSLAQQRDSLSMVDDQVGAPTSAALIAEVVATALARAARNPSVSGLYHLAAAGAVSRRGYAEHVLERAAGAGVALRTRAADIRSLHSEDFPSAARRPLNSRLDTRKLEQVFGVQLPAWQTGVDRHVGQLVAATRQRQASA